MEMKTEQELEVGIDGFIETEVEEEIEIMNERYELSVQRIAEILKEETVGETYRTYFREVGAFLLEVDQVYVARTSGEWETYSVSQKQEINKKLYCELEKEQYEKSTINPTISVQLFGKELGQILSVLQAELRSAIASAFECNYQYLTIYNELFIQIYNCFEGVEEVDLIEVRDLMYWYAYDYCDVFLADRIEEMVNPDTSFARDIIMNCDLATPDYLYEFGEAITENEIRTSEFIHNLPEETVDRMASVYVEGYRRGFELAGKDLSKKSVVNIYYSLGFERMIRKAILLFQELGLQATVHRASASFITKNQNQKNGYSGAQINKQYEYDHKDDQAIVLDKKIIERKLDVMKHTYESMKELAAGVAGPAVVEVFGEAPFAPKKNEYAPKLSEQQEKIAVQYKSKSSQIVNQYIIGEERSFTIISFPTPEIGEQFEEIFHEVIKINTLDVEVFERVQQCIIDALDQGEYVKILGKGKNKTDLTIQLQKLGDPNTQTGFENCVADVNIPAGEVFTSPSLEGTYGLLHVTEVFLNELQFKDIELAFEDGYITKYTCKNFQDEELNKKFVKESVLSNRETLPMGEFAIGTNTTAYVTAKKYGIADKLPILIAEKMGPHFAVGDTCYSWNEDLKVYNPNGKEIVAKDNSLSILRKEDVSKAYTYCHTDITIPYDELKEITVVTASGEEIKIIENERFVLKGTEVLNEAFDHL